MITKKRFFGILLGLALMLGLMPGTGLTAYADTNVAKVGETEYATLSEALNAWNDGTILTLLADVETANTISMSSGTRTFTLNGHNITKTGASGSVFQVTGSSSLTVNGTGSISGGRGTPCDTWEIRGGGFYVADNAEVTVNNVTITGNTAFYGGGVFLSNNATFTMNNGTISHNHINNKNGWTSGGGVWIQDSGTFIMNGGSVTENTADSQIAGIHVYDNGTFKVSGNAIVTNNKRGGSQINVSGTITVDGELTEGANIGVYHDAGVFTNSTNTDYNDASKFTSDNASYAVGKNANRQLLLGIPVTVTYKVVNGTWSNDSTTDKTETVASGSKPASVPTGMKAASGYTGGAWDPDPADATITGATTFTYTFTAKPNPAVGYFTYSAPSDLTYDGNAKSATVVGASGMGQVTVKYYSDEACTTEVQSPTDVGTYYVGITTEEGDNYSAVSTVLHDESWQFTINRATPNKDNFTYSAPSDLTYDGNAKSATVVGASGMGQVTVKYYSDEACTTEVQSPTDVGTYYVGITTEEGTNYSEVSTVLHDGTWQFTINKQAAPASLNDNQKPTAKTGLTYTGSDQALVTAPSEIPDGYIEVQYALGTETEATQPYTTSIPTATDAGTYYVWYKAVGDETHGDSEVGNLTVIINPAGTPELTDTQKPKPVSGLTYSGEPQTLVTKPEEDVPGYTVKYSIDGGETWSTEPPTGTDAKTYTVKVWYEADNGNHESFYGEDIAVTIGKAMELTVEADNVLQGNGARGIPSEIQNLDVKLDITITSDDGKTASTVKPMELKLNNGEASLTQNVEFDQMIENLVPGRQTVAVTVSPKVIYGRDKIYSSDGPVEGSVKWKYELSAVGEINMKDGKMIVRIYLIWDDGSRPEEIKVYALPEDEIGAYALRDNGTKEYLLFHTYDICMAWLGDDELCSGYERCFHKESPFVNPFVK